MTHERRSHNRNRDNQDDIGALAVVPHISTSTVGIDQEDGGRVYAAPARPRIINQGIMKIYSDYTGDTDIINMPGCTVELVGSPYQAASHPVEHYQSPVTYTSSRQTTTTAATVVAASAAAAKPVARYYCLSCKVRYFTQERLDQHVKEYPNYCAECKSCRKKNAPGDRYCCLNYRGYSSYWLPGKGGAVDDTR